MTNERKSAERAARRARRLAERAAERARRKERHAQRAAERAERLAERVKRRPSRERDLDQSIGDLVDEATSKAEAWIDEQTEKLFGTDSDNRDSREARRAAAQARKAQEDAEFARENARHADEVADELSELHDEDFDAFYGDELDEDPVPRRRRRGGRRGRHYSGSWHGMSMDELGLAPRKRGRNSRRKPRRKPRRQRSAQLYRDGENSKVCGVCAGLSDYLGREAWEIRLAAVMGLIFIPSITVPAYFALYFLMDDKPYYRRVTDRFEDQPGSDEAGEMSMKSGQNYDPRTQERPSNVQAMSEARRKFSDIEQRLREMEGHVTSSRFQLQKELKKISGDS